MSGPTQSFDGTPSWEGVFQPPHRPKLPPNPNAIRPIARTAGGPQTEAGKAIASGNSTTHGLTAKRVVLPGEDQSEFDALLDRLTVDLNPQGELEIQLTGEVAAVIWRLNRARDHEARFFETNRDPYDRGGHKLELIMRYSGSIERHMHRTIARLELSQKQRRKLASNEFVSQLTENNAPEAAPLGQPAVVAAPEFVSQLGENEPERAPLVMAAGVSLRDQTPVGQPAVLTGPEFVSPLTEKKESAPLTMAAGASLRAQRPLGQPAVTGEFVSQLTEKKEAAPLVMAAGASLPDQETPDAPAATEVPEFVSQPEEDTPEAAPLVMAAGRSLPYDFDAPCEPSAPVNARKCGSHRIDFFDPSFDPFVRFPHIKKLEDELERAVRERLLRDGC